MIEFSDFEKVDIRVGRIVEAAVFERARKPSFKVCVDFGPEIGTKWSSTGVRGLYTAEELIGRQVLAVINFEPRNIAGFMSEVLVLGLPDAEGRVVLVSPDQEVPVGGRLF
ncbi:MAG: tRNA-binding protein [Fimbriimonadaceae bacterium]